MIEGLFNIGKNIVKAIGHAGAEIGTTGAKAARHAVSGSQEKLALESAQKAYGIITKDDEVLKIINEMGSHSKDLRGNSPVLADELRAAMHSAQIQIKKSMNTLERAIRNKSSEQLMAEKKGIEDSIRELTEEMKRAPKTTISELKNILDKKKFDLDKANVELKGITDSAAKAAKSNEIRDLKNEVDGLEDAIKSGDEASSVSQKRYLDDLKDRLKAKDIEISEFEDTKAKYEYYTEAQKAISSGDYHSVAQKLLQSGPQQAAWTEETFGSDILGKIRTIAIGDTMRSPYLNNPEKFLKQYIHLKKNGPPEVFRAFEANYDNVILLDRIRDHQPDLVAKVIEKGYYNPTIRSKLLGLTPEQFVKRIGVAGVVTGATVLTMKAHLWISNHSEQVAGGAENIYSSLDAIQATGEGATIVESLKDQLSNIYGAASGANRELDSDPEAAAQYTNTMVERITDFGKTFSQGWGTVVASAKNKAAVVAAESMINGFFNSQATSFQELNGAIEPLQDNLTEPIVQEESGTEQNDAISGKKTAPAAMPASDPRDIARVQRFLKSRYPTIQASGKIDNSTIYALRDLENKLNARVKDEKFAGRLINPEADYVISYDELMDIFDRIKKY